MTRLACSIAIALFLIANSPARGLSQQLYLYTPTAVDSVAGASGKDGILVQEVSVQKGDTLYGLSRKFSGRGSFYPQILLFNSIKDPDKIYPGDLFRVPVSQKRAESAQPVHEKSASAAHDAAVVVPAAPAQNKTTPATIELNTADLKKIEAAKEKKNKKVASPAKKPNAPDSNASAGQNLFENAVKAYRQDDCKTALELFDRYLADNQASPLAADASFYKAECYLKLSTKN